MHFLQEMNDEGLYGLLARNMHINGFGDHLRGMKKLTGQRLLSLADVPISKALLNTPYAHSGLGTSLVERHLGDNEKHDQDLVRYSYGLVSGRLWKTCPECWSQDEVRRGIASWHRVHQLPTTLICPIHRISLNPHKISKKIMHDRLLLPFDSEVIQTKVHSSSEDHLYALAMLGQRALNDQDDPYSPETIKQVFISEMIMRGYILKGKLARQFIRDFQTHFGDACVHLINAEMGVGNIVSLLDGILNNETSVISLNRLILVHWWFGQWQHFKHKCLWLDTFRYLESKKSAYDFESIRLQYRRRCLDLLESNNAMDRSILLKQEYKVFRWLRANDRKWLDLYFPILGRDYQLGLFI